MDTFELDALFSAAVDAIVVADTTGRILRANPSSYRLFGYDDGELVGQPVNVLMPPGEAAKHDQYMHHHMETGDERIIGHGREVEGRRKDGSIFPLHLSVGRADGPDGTRFVAILHDLTRRRITEQALERSQRLEAIGQMTGGIAHDFNNLLTLVIGNLELVSHRDITPEVRDLVHDALDAAEMGADLTSRLLAFARQSRLSPERLDTNAVVSRVASLFRQQLKPGVRIDLALAPSIWPIDTDPAMLQGALVNLLRNSNDAIEGDGVILFSTECTNIDDAYISQDTGVVPGNYVRIAISDTGTGMTPEVRRRAFEPFFTTKPPGKGTGLGLATVYGFVRQSGGHASIYSEPGQGTTVNLYLPATVTDTDAATQKKPGAEAGLPGRGELILVVEDDPAVRSMTATRLGALGYSVIDTATADEALEVLSREDGVRLVFSDMMMPGSLTGLDLARRLRRTRPGLPVLLTTGYAGEMTDAELVDGFPLLRKPYRQEDLADAISRALMHAERRSTRE